MEKTDINRKTKSIIEIMTTLSMTRAAIENIFFLFLLHTSIIDIINEAIRNITNKYPNISYIQEEVRRVNKSINNAVKHNDKEVIPKIEFFKSFVLPFSLDVVYFSISITP